MKELQKRNFTTDDLRKEVENCLYKIKEIGLIKNNERNINNYEFSFNSRKLNTYGTCKTIVPNKKYLITLNLLYVQYGTIEQIRNTIMHEILHSLPNGHGHKGKWKQYASIVNSKYLEYHISRTSYSKEYQLALKANIVPNYTLICPNCNETWRYQRKTKLISNLLYYKGKYELTCPYCKTTKENWRLKIKDKEIIF